MERYLIVSGVNPPWSSRNTLIKLLGTIDSTLAPDPRALTSDHATISFFKRDLVRRGWTVNRDLHFQWESNSYVVVRPIEEGLDDLAPFLTALGTWSVQTLTPVELDPAPPHILSSLIADAMLLSLPEEDE